jgi:MATE family multidrug resistance protein
VLIGLTLGAAAAGALAFGGAGLLTAFGIDPLLADAAGGVMAVLGLSIPAHLVYLAGAYFLEAVRRPIAATAVMWLANLVNIALNAVLIPLHGAEGSAWATLGARVFLAVAVTGFILTMAEGAALGVWRTPKAPPNNASYASLLRVGVASCVSQTAEAGAFSAMTVIAGRIGADAAAAYSILLNLLAAPFMVALGLAGAAAVVVSEAEGRGSRAQAASAAWAALGLVVCAMIGLGAGLTTAPQTIANGFTADPMLAAAVGAHILWVAMILTPDGAQVVAASSLRARGDNWFPTASHLLAYAAVMPVMAIWLAEHEAQGVSGLMAAIFWASALSAGVLAARLAWLARRADAG